jgi:uncharacterized membrane protein YhdT
MVAIGLALTFLAMAGVILSAVLDSRFYSDTVVSAWFHCSCVLGMVASFVVLASLLP